MTQDTTYSNGTPQKSPKGRISRVCKRRRRRGECPIKIKAIRNHCLECMGWSEDEVAECTNPACWLFPWRMGVTPEAAAKQGRDVE